MTTKDINLYESGSGGEIAIADNDIVLTEQLYQQAYLCLFGGNIEAVTKGNEPDDEPRVDYWQNELLYNQRPQKQFNSLTEKALRDNPLTSVGRVNVQAAVMADLAYFKTIANIEVNVVILSTNLIEIIIKLTQPQNQQDKILQFIWDNAKSELVTDKKI